MKLALLICALVLGAVARTAKKNSVAEPEYLDQLLKEKRYEEFSYLMGIDNSELVRPNEQTDIDPMFNDILGGDILYARRDDDEDQARQGINFQRYPGSKWPDRKAFYTLSDEFNDNEKSTINKAINTWNEQISCIKFVQRTSENDYVLFFPGRGCYSQLGRRGGQQPLSLQKRGCVHERIVLHEMEHAIGFAHEHNRSDRDDFVKVLWRNIPPRWRSQYRKTNPRDFGLQSTYDYYSLMHYPYNAPGTRRPAFEILKDGIDSSRLGNSPGFTDTDKEKICILYA